MRLSAGIIKSNLVLRIRDSYISHTVFFLTPLIEWYSKTSLLNHSITIDKVSLHPLASA